MLIDFDTIIDRNNTCSMKWDYNEKTFGREDILPMWVADMDFPSSSHIIEAIKKRAEHGSFGYTRVSEQYNQAVINWMMKRNNWLIKDEWLVHSPGVVTSINNAILAFTEVQDRILIQTPVYHPFFSGVIDNSRQLVTNPLLLKNGYYSIDFEDLESKLKNNVKMMILCNPHNPVGRVWSKEELLQISELCIKYKVMLVSDEIHSDIVYKGNRHISIASLSDDMLQNAITLISPTKTFNIAGLATSLAIIPNKTINSEFQKFLRNTGAGMLNIFGLTAGEAAFKHGEEWLEALIEYLQSNLEVLSEYFQKNIPAIKLIKPEATYLCWMDCRNLLKEEENISEFFIKKAGVGLNNGAMFGVDGSGFQRINFACPRKVLLEGLQRIENAVNKLI